MPCLLHCSISSFRYLKSESLPIRARTASAIRPDAVESGSAGRTVPAMVSPGSTFSEKLPDLGMVIGRRQDDVRNPRSFALRIRDTVKLRMVILSAPGLVALQRERRRVCSVGSIAGPFLCYGLTCLNDECAAI